MDRARLHVAKRRPNRFVTDLLGEFTHRFAEPGRGLAGGRADPDEGEVVASLGGERGEHHPDGVGLPRAGTADDHAHFGGESEDRSVVLARCLVAQKGREHCGRLRAGWHAGAPEPFSTSAATCSS